MIKSWLITIAVLLAFVAAYHLNLSFKVLGNPFRKADDDDDTRH